MQHLTFNDRDEFNRKPIAENIIKLLISELEVSPMVIDGDWGTGKSEFCHKLINLFSKQESHHLIYVDAFKADHADEPLMTLLAEVFKVLPDGEVKKTFGIRPYQRFDLAPKQYLRQECLTYFVKTSLVGGD